MIDNKILLMRLEDKSYVKTILLYIVKYNPFYELDELICLKHILNVLDKHKLPYSRGEVRKALNIFYQERYHGNKKTYLNWLSKHATKKIVYPDKLQSILKRVYEPSKKEPIANTTGYQSACFNGISEQSNTNPHPRLNNPLEMPDEVLK